jgi:hypothetical protein
MNNKIYKFLALAIVIKRKHRNSILLTEGLYKKAHLFNLSPQTIKFHLIELEKLGLATCQGKRYTLASFRRIHQVLLREKGLRFNYHNILKGNCTDFKKACNMVEQYLVQDNIIAPQQFMYQQKMDDIRLLSKVFTDTKHPKRLAPREYRRFKALSKKQNGEKQLEILKKSSTNIVLTSSRHTGKKLGWSPPKASKVLKLADIYEKREIVSFIDGATAYNFDMAKANNPKATVYPLMSVNKIKIHYGTELRLKGDEKQHCYYRKNNEGSLTKNTISGKSVFPPFFIGKIAQTQIFKRNPIKYKSAPYSIDFSSLGVDILSTAGLSKLDASVCEN